MYSFDLKTTKKNIWVPLCVLYVYCINLSFPPIGVVYFDQGLGAAHPKDWSNRHFQHFLCLKAEKMQKSNKFGVKLSRKWCFELAPKC